MLVAKLGAPELDFDSEAAEPLRRVMFLDSVDNRLYPRCYSLEIHRFHLQRRQPVSLCVPCLAPDARRIDECLAGNTAVVKTVPSQQVFLVDKESFCTQLGGARGDRP